MDFNEIKLSDIIKMLKRAGFKAFKLDLMKVNPFPSIDESRLYFKYNGSLHIQGENVGFSIMAKGDPCNIGYKYEYSAIAADGIPHEHLTNWPQLFFPRLFGYLSGEISEVEIITELCGQAAPNN